MGRLVIDLKGLDHVWGLMFCGVRYHYSVVLVRQRYKQIPMFYQRHGIITAIHDHERSSTTPDKSRRGSAEDPETSPHQAHYHVPQLFGPWKILLSSMHDLVGCPKPCVDLQ